MKVEHTVESTTHVPFSTASISCPVGILASPTSGQQSTTVLPLRSTDAPFDFVPTTSSSISPSSSAASSDTTAPLPLPPTVSSASPSVPRSAQPTQSAIPTHKLTVGDIHGPAHAAALSLPSTASLTSEQLMQVMMKTLETPLNTFSSDISANGRGGSTASLVSFASSAHPPVPPSKPIPTAMRVGSWNVNHLNDRLLSASPAADVLNLMAAVIDAHFDIIVLQEVAIGTSQDALKRLLTVMRSRFSEENWQLRLTGSKGEVHAFFYRGTLVSSTMHAPECIADGLTHAAGMLFVECSVPRLSTFRLALLSVHLKSAAEKMASSELVSLLQHVDKHTSSIIKEGALIVLGDFNLDKVGIERVLNDPSRLKLKPKLLAYIEHSTMSSATSTKCNDNLLVSDRLTVIERSARVVDSVDAVMDPHHQLRTLSDHLPVVVSVLISPP